MDLRSDISVKIGELRVRVQSTHLVHDDFRVSIFFSKKCITLEINAQ